MSQALRFGIVALLLAATPALAQTTQAQPRTAGEARVEGAGSSATPRTMPFLHDPAPRRRNPDTGPCQGLPPGALDCQPMTK